MTRLINKSNKKNQKGLTLRNGFINSTPKSHIKDLKEDTHKKGLDALLKGNYDLALNFYNTALISGNSAELYFERGLAYNALNRINESLNDYKKAVEINPNHEKAWHNITALFYDNRELAIEELLIIEGDIDQNSLELELLDAIGSLSKKATEINPKYDISHNLTGLINYRRGILFLNQAKFKEALKCFKKSSDSFFCAIESNQKELNYFYSYASSLYESARITKDIKTFEIAKETFIEYLKKIPNQENAMIKLACVYADLGEFNNSRQTCEKILKKNSNHPGAQTLINRMNIRKL